MFRTGFVLSVLFSFFAASLSAQQQEPKESKETKVASGAHSEIILYLKSGDKVRGFVKNNQFSEKSVGKEFISVKSGEKGAGLRLYFIEDTQSYVFFPETVIQKYQIVRGISDQDMRALSTKLTKAASDRKQELLQDQAPVEEATKPTEEEAAKAPEKTDKKESAAPAPAKPMTPEKAEAAKQKAEEEAEAKALLEKFSPEAGWSIEKYDSIRQNRVNDIYPTKEEAEFEKNFKKWKQAFLAEQESKQKELEKHEAEQKNQPGEEKKKSPPSESASGS